MTYRLDTLRSHVAFSVRHVGGRVHGSFTRVAGEVSFDPTHPEATAVRVTIQSASVATHHELRDARLRSAGFLDARTFPEITFVSTAARRSGRQLMLTGELAIRGVGRPVTVTVGRVRTRDGQGGRGTRIAAVARAQLRRSDFGVGPSTALDGGGLLIGDEIAVDMDLELSPA
jgi:polyisoprenoid-binding protein YceI